MSMDLRKLPATDLQVSTLGLDLTGELPMHTEAVLHRALHDGVNLVRLPLGEAGRRARIYLRRVGPDPRASLVVVGVLPQGLVDEAPTMVAQAHQELSMTYRLLLEVRPPDLLPARSAPLPALESTAAAAHSWIGVRIDPPLIGPGFEGRADFVSVPHSVWAPAIRPSPASGFGAASVGILALDPWAGLTGLPDPLGILRLNPTGSPGPAPISRLREEARPLTDCVELVRLEGRPLPEIAVRFALDTPGVSAVLLPLPTPELWLKARHAAESAPLSSRGQEWILHHGSWPRDGPSPEGEQW
ncbi:MAG: hypothetical protein AAFA34_03475 [Thermoplasmata archaeon]|jgi:hypothetical protein